MPIDAEWIINTARSIIVDKEVQPMLFISYKDDDERDGVAIVAFAVPSEVKFSAMRTVGHKFADKECDAIAMISEAWISKVDVKTHPEVKVEDIVPSKDPNRTEALVYVKLEKSGDTEFRMYEIERGLDGPVLIEQPKSGEMKFQPFLLQQFWKGWEDKSGSDEGFEMKKWEREQ
jgi:hypothetical protein